MKSPRKNVRYHPPAPHVIQEYAAKVCENLGIKQSEIVQDLGHFVKLVASIKSRHVNEQQALDNEQK